MPRVLFVFLQIQADIRNLHVKLHLRPVRMGRAINKIFLRALFTTVLKKYWRPQGPFEAERSMACRPASAGAIFGAGDFVKLGASYIEWGSRGF